MTDFEPKEKAQRIISQQLLALEDLRHEFGVPGGDFTLGREQLKRWKEFTIDLLSESVNEREAQKLREKRPGSPILGQPLRNFLQEIAMYDAFLSALNDELSKNPDRVLSALPAPGNVAAPAALRPRTPKLDPEKRTVFVIHGRDERLRAGMFEFLRSLDLKPLEWTEAVKATGKGSPYIGEILDAAFSRAQAVVVLFTPDDEARLRAALQATHEPSYEMQLTAQARPNVLFEAGMAMASDPDRTILVQIGDTRPFSDIAGRHTIRMDSSTAKRQDLALRLQAAGCTVKLSGTDWQKAGDLTPPVIQAAVPSSKPAIQFTGSRLLRIAQVGHSLWSEDRSHGIQAVALEFANEAQPGARNTEIIAKASLVYSDSRGECLRVGAGCWINEQTDMCNFRVEDTHALLVAFVSGQQFSTISKRRKYADMGGGEIVQTDEHTLAGFREGFVRVRLTDADGGALLYEGNFDLSFDPLTIVPKRSQ